MTPTKTSVLQTLCRSHPILSEQLSQTHLSYSDERLWEHLLTLPNINPSDFSEALSIPVKDQKNLFIDSSFLQSYTSSYIQKTNLFPLYESETHIGLAVINPFNGTIPTECTNKIPALYLVSPQTFESLVLHHFPNCESDTLDMIIESAVLENASDIHISQKENHVSIARRIQGRLDSFLTLFNPNMGKTLFRLIKLHANMNTATLQGPQDGRIHRQIGNITVDIRVASLPTLFGEDLVLRLFRSSDPVLSIAKCGFTPPIQTHIHQMLQETSGLICVTGPTGSGKTTTLYAMIDALLEQHRGQIISIEDPIERVIPKIRQSQLNPKAQYSYTQALKATLRQDPDIIVIGEVRDKETARYVLDAAYTGHLVLTSLHTSDVKSTLLRLLHFELDPFLISHCLKGIISQRLIPKPCTLCQTGCPSCRFTQIASQTVGAESFSPSEKSNILTTSTIGPFISAGHRHEFQYEL